MKLVVSAFVIYVFFNPSLGSWLYLGLIILLMGWISLVSKQKITPKSPDKYTPDEIAVIEKYPIFFQYPFVSRNLSATFSAIQLSTFILVPLLLIKMQYIQAIILGISYFFTAGYAVKLNPQFFLHDNLDKGKIKDFKTRWEFEMEMRAIDNALEKLYLKKHKSK